MSKSIRRREFLQHSAGAAMAAAWPLSGAEAAKEWRYYGGDAGATRYSAAEQINKSNVKKLKVAWTHRTGDAMERPATAIECTPIVVDGVMYLTTAQVKVQAIDPATGQRKWTFDPMGGRGSRRSPGVNRAVTYWQQGKEKRIRPKAPCIVALPAPKTDKAIKKKARFEPRKIIQAKTL